MSYNKHKRSGFAESKQIKTEKIKGPTTKSTAMEMVPKWEDLNMDCLVNILGRVDTENLLLDVPYVCKSWYKATCDPRCWLMLNFVDDRYDCVFPDIQTRLTRKYGLNDSSSVNRFIEFVVKRGNGFTTCVKLPSLRTEDSLVYISEKCPNLRTLKLPCTSDLFEKGDVISPLVRKWRRLESLTLPNSYNLCAILAQISVHCKNFGALEIQECRIREDDASALVTYVPNLKSLSLRCADIGHYSLLKILNGCKKLEYLDASDCLGFEEDDHEILNCAAHIRTLNLEGSTFFWNNNGHDYYYRSSDDDYVLMV